jgi:hypothetical protein
MRISGRYLFTPLLILVLAAPVRAGYGPTTASMEAQIKNLAGVTTTFQAQITVLQAQVAALQATIASANAQNAFALGQFVSVNTTDTINGVKPPHIFFIGANLHVEDGSGHTVNVSGSTANAPGSLSGLGNLIVGYTKIPRALRRVTVVARTIS